MPEQLQAAHRPQPLGKLAVIEPAPMPLEACPDLRIEDDREGDHYLERGEFEFEVRRHECAEAETYGHSAEQEIEDVSAAVGLGEMRREPVGPAVRLFEQVDRSVDLVRFGAPLAVAPPFVADLRFAMLVGEILGAESPHARRREQQWIFDARTDVAQPFVREALQEILLLLVRRRHQQALKQGVHVRPIERPLDGRLVGGGEDRRVERTPQQAGGASDSGGK